MSAWAMRPTGVDAGKWAGTRQRWIEAGRGGETQAMRKELAASLGISHTTLYAWAKRLGWPRGNYRR